MGEPNERYICFDSILVRLKVSTLQECCPRQILCFDSILVRLKVLRYKFNRKSRCTFRFHTGSIKSEGESAGGGDPGERFDSILVRLKVVRHSAVAGVGRFRFHTGSIKRKPPLLY